MMEFPTTVIGTDLYCPDCGRRLVHVHGDGTYDLAFNSTARLTGTVGDDEPPLLEGAECLDCVGARRRESIGGWERAAAVVERLAPAGRFARWILAWIGFFATLIAITDWIAR